MSRESDFKTLLDADAPLNAILTGGIYKSEDVGVEGISRETTPSAFSSGFLLPCALIKQRGEIVTQDARDYDSVLLSTEQVVEIWLYEDRGYTNIDSAKSRLITVLHGHMFSNAFEAVLANVIDRQRDEAALKGNSLTRLDWQISSIVQ
jgi:hypothetical protein